MFGWRRSMYEIVHPYKAFREAGKTGKRCASVKNIHPPAPEKSNYLSVARIVQPISGALQLVVKEHLGRYGPSQDDGSVDFYYDSRHLDVDLGSAIYEEIVTSLPMKPLCSEDCKGIEMQRDVGTRMSKNESDPRWEALKKSDCLFSLHVQHRPCLPCCF
jgi:hypothetical protein